MTREIFKEQLLKKIEQQIFNELKDTPITGSKYILNKWNGLDIDYSAVYRRIVNYQIKKYGYSLTTSEKQFTGVSKEEADKLSRRKKQRRAYWRNHEYKRERKKD